MKKNLKGTLIFDNGGGLTLQLNNAYAHWYQNMEQSAEDLKVYMVEGNTYGWDGHEEDQLELVPEDEQIQNGGYRVYSMQDIISMTEEEYMDIGWGNIRDFCTALNSENKQGTKMEDATLIKSYNIGGKTTELRFTPKAKIQTWPGYDDSLPLRYAGYWYGTHDNHEHIGKTEKEALEYLSGNYGI